MDATAVQCPKLNIADAVIDSTEVSYGTAVSVTCKRGYAIDGTVATVAITCLANSSWSMTEINCVRKFNDKLFVILTQHATYI